VSSSVQDKVVFVHENGHFVCVTLRNLVRNVG